MEMLPLPTDTSENEERILTPEEIQSYVAPQYAATGNPLPDPATSQFIGVIRGGKIVAALGLQVKLHAQPLMIDDGHGAVLPALVKAAERIILERCGPQWVYLFTPAGKLTQLAQSLGMQLEPWCVCSKLVAPAIPDKPLDMPEMIPLESMAPEGGTQ